MKLKVILWVGQDTNQKLSYSSYHNSVFKFNFPSNLLESQIILYALGGFKIEEYKSVMFLS